MRLVRRKSFVRGFTLLELLLAMVIIAAIILYVSVHVKDQTEERKLQQTSIEIQNLQQAVANYYLFYQDQFYGALAQSVNTTKTAYQNFSSGYQVNNAAGYNFWPGSINNIDPYLALSTNGAMSGTFVADTYTNGSSLQFCSSWDYIESVNGPGCEVAGIKRQTYQFLDKGQYFGVGILLPTSQLADKLVAILPGAVIDSSNANLVISYIPRPVAHYNPALMTKPCDSSNTHCTTNDPVGARGWIATAGVTGAYNYDPGISASWGEGNFPTRNRTIMLPTCPKGYEGHFITSYLQVQTGNCVWQSAASRNVIQNAKQQMFWHMKLLPKGLSGSQTSIDSAIGNYQTSGFSPLAACTTWPFSLWGLANLLSNDPGFMVVNFMTMCVPKGHWFGPKSTEMRCNNGSNNSMGWTTQCQGDWYNGYNESTNIDTSYCQSSC